MELLCQINIITNGDGSGVRDGSGVSDSATI